MCCTAQICPTVGFNIKTLDYKGYVLNMWDVGGQKSIRTYWRNYFEQTDGIVWVVDSVDQWRLEECKRQLRELLVQEVRCINVGRVRVPRVWLIGIFFQKLAGASLLIFANKQDLAGALSMERIAELLDLRADDMAGRHWTIFACSAYTGSGLVEGVDWIVSDIASRIFISA